MAFPCSYQGGGVDNGANGIFASVMAVVAAVGAAGAMLLG